MKNTLLARLILLSLVFNFWASGALASGSIFSKPIVFDESLTVKWNSPKGLKMLESSQFKADFYELADYFQPQINPLYCGAATSVIILNAMVGNGEAPSQKDLEVVKPKIFGGGNIEFKTYSQATFFNENTDKIKDRKIINLANVTLENENSAKNFDPGLTLLELRNILSKTYDLNVKMWYVQSSNLETINKFRKLVKKIVAEDQKYLIINFKGEVLKLKTGGHISPVVAFDEASDSVLILDVAGHKNGWYWAKIADVVKAMNTRDGQKYRGYLVVTK
ncbi:MAG: hypothetical protein ACI9TO_000508 [Rickettsiales bacterium]|jgi:hypothetical protein